MKKYIDLKNKLESRKIIKKIYHDISSNYKLLSRIPNRYKSKEYCNFLVDSYYIIYFKFL